MSACNRWLLFNDAQVAAVFPCRRLRQPEESVRMLLVSYSTSGFDLWGKKCLILVSMAPSITQGVRTAGQQMVCAAVGLRLPPPSDRITNRTKTIALPSFLDVLFLIATEIVAPGRHVIRFLWDFIRRER